MCGANRTKLKGQGFSLDDEDEWHLFRNAVRATVQETPTSTSVGRGRSPSPSLRLPPQAAPPQLFATFSFNSTMPRKELDKRSVSPHLFPLLRSGSVSNRPKTPKSSRPTTPNMSTAKKGYPSEPWKSASIHIQAERESHKESEQIPSKSKLLLKSLLSRHKSKKDELLYTYLDEY